MHVFFPSFDKVLPRDTISVTEFEAILPSSSVSAEVTMQKATMLLEAINRVNCTGAPDCNELNRKHCRMQINTCGACLSELYVGETGSSNSKCILKTTASLLMAPDALQTQASVCLSDGDCSLPWQTCSMETRVCISRQKTCVADCLGHGVCMHKDLLNGGSADNCMAADVWCVSYCECNVGYGGSYCHIQIDEFNARASYVRRMLDDMTSLSGYQSLLVGGENTYSDIEQTFISAVISEPKFLALYGSYLNDMVDSFVGLQIGILKNMPSQQSLYEFTSRPYEFLDGFIMIENPADEDEDGHRNISISSISSISNEGPDDRRRLSTFVEADEILPQLFRMFSSEMISGQFPVENMYTHYACGYYSPLPLTKGNHLFISAPVSLSFASTYALPSTTTNSTTNMNHRAQLRFDQESIGPLTHIGIVSTDRAVVLDFSQDLAGSY